MAKRRKYRKSKLKLKLRKTTIYSIFSFGMILSGLLIALSFTKTQPSLAILSDEIDRYFGGTSFIFPLVLIFFGFLFLRLKIFISKPNVAIGFLLFFISVNALFKEGLVGEYLFRTIAGITTDTGAFLVYTAGIFIGIVVFFDTSIDEIIGMISTTFKNLPRFFPKKFFSFFKNSTPSGFKDRPLTIKGGSGDFPKLSEKEMVISESGIKKDSILLADKLVSNTASDGKTWEYPPLSLLSDSSGHKAERGDVNKIAKTIEQTLESFNVRARVVEVNLGPAVTQYAIEIAQGTKLSKITSLSNDLALSTEAPTGQIRIEAPIPGRNLVGIEIPNRSLEIVTLRTMLESSAMRKSKSKLTVSMGLDVSGNPIVADIARMPHVLIAGTTGSGKSVMINSFISSLLFRASPAEIKLIMIDPKRVELTTYNGIPHLMTPVIVEVEKILASLKWAMNQMDERYKKFAQHGVKNIDSYNELSGFQALPYIVILIDELADLMAFAPVEVEDAIARLAQMARATGIHLVVSTQRPSVDVITGLIKANIPTRIAFNVSSMIDSRVILDSPGAEKLLGRGDMLYIPPEQAKPTRIQGAFVSEREVKKLVDFLKEKGPPAEYTDEVTQTPLVSPKPGSSMGAGGRDVHFEEAIRVVCQHDRASASLLQRRLSIGYSRAARIIDQLEAAGIVSPGTGSKPRDVLIRNADEIISSLNQ